MGDKQLYLASIAIRPAMITCLELGGFCQELVNLLTKKSAQSIELLCEEGRWHS